MAGLVLAWGVAQAAGPAPRAPVAPAKSAAAAPGSPAPDAAATPETEPPDDLRVLRLTDQQRKILDRIFQRHAFENPPQPRAGASLDVTVEPTVPGGLYRLGPGGDLPVRLTVTVHAFNSPAKVGLRYLVEDFYGRKAADGSMPAVITSATGAATAELTLKELTAFGYYHVLVTATTESQMVIVPCGVAVIYPQAETSDSSGPFGLVTSPGTTPDQLTEIGQRLGIGADRIGSSVNLPSKVPDENFAAAAQKYRAEVAESLHKPQKAGSHFVTADLETLVDVLTEGPVLAGAGGVALCLDASAVAPNLRGGAFQRSLDYARQIAGRMGIKHVYMAGTGEDPADFSPQQQAWKLVTRNVMALAGGAERVYVAQGRGIPTPLPSAAAYAWMTHLLHGTSYKDAVWPEVPLLEGHIFSGHGRSVAVVWSWIGEDAGTPDRGALVLENGTRLEVHDVVGSPVGIWKGERLILPLGEAPVYITSTDLSAGQLRDRLRSAKILGVAPATVWIKSLLPGDSPDRMTATLWVQSHRPSGADGVAGIIAPPGWKVRQAKETFGLGAGQAREVSFDLDRVAPAKDETASPDAAQRPVDLPVTVLLNEEPVRRTQAVWPTAVPERTIDVGYGLDDWEGIPPVVVVSDSGGVRAEVRAAWDSKFFYFAAAVHRERHSFVRGRYASDGDAIQLAWGVDDRADDDFGNRGLPAGAFRDTDHLMALTFGKDGAQVIRLRGPHMMLRDHVPGNMDAMVGPVEGAAADIARDAAGKVTLYEAAIPLKALAPLRVERGRTVRFSFRIGDGRNPPLEWSRAAGVPDFLAGPGSFLPMSSAEGLPCQTVWKFTGPTKAEKK
jgi:hypothetical protein